ncbi:RNA pol II carboxy terminal domain phosphatase [Cryptosporidium xiaoi]|uniref:protein-serine/threonine phosphatase n=1 Tax=Cryptosporidium xiaoi TaxID=659607 RepID=A0AAV9Y349_9CRYT
MNKNEIQIRISREAIEFPIRLEWKKYKDDKIKPGEIILEIYDGDNKLISKIKSICNGRVRDCYTPKKCGIIREEINIEDNTVYYVGIDDDEHDIKLENNCNEFLNNKTNEKERVYSLKLNLINGPLENKSNIKGKLCFGYYSCDHTTFVSGICAECGYVLDNSSNKDDRIKVCNNRNLYDNNARVANGKYRKTNADNSVISAGFISNDVDIKFNREYVNEQEKLFIYELLYLKNKLSLVLDLDNTLIHATSNLPEISNKFNSDKTVLLWNSSCKKSKELSFYESHIDIKTIMSCGINEETYNKYFGSVVLMGKKQTKNELLPEGFSSLPHYITNENSEFSNETQELYFKLLESLIFCIPYDIDLNWSCGYYKLRPGVLNMLKTLSKDKYEIYMYTMGTECHAYMSLRILDPEIRFFSPKRIFYRNNGFIDSNIKSLSTLFPHDHRSLIILDDIEQAWTDINSLLKVYPYNFFPSNSITNDPHNFSRYISTFRTNNKWNRYLNKKRCRQESGSELEEESGITHSTVSENENIEDCSTSPRVKIFQVIKEIIGDEKDQQLVILQKILEAIHEAYFIEFNCCISKQKSSELEYLNDDCSNNAIEDVYRYAPNVANIIKIMRKNVLLDSKIQFTGFKNKFLYDFKETDLYKWCRYFGSCILEDNTNKNQNTASNGCDPNPVLPNYCICEQLYTQKYHNAVENNIPCLTILWLETIIYTWIRPCYLNIDNPIYKDPMCTEHHSPFESIEFNNNGDFVSNYRHIDLYNSENSKTINEQIWQEVFDDVSFPIDNNSSDSDSG